MPKRTHDDYSPDLPHPKRPRKTRVGHTDYISSLSDEILLHIFSFLPIPSLLVCQRLSRRLYTLAGDSELWKRQYYTRWVRPRARRLAGVRRTAIVPRKIQYSPQVSTWLDHSHLATEGSSTNWKRQYRLRHNWSKGACRVSEVVFPQLPSSPLLVNFCAGYVLTADSDHGLRMWDVGDAKSCLARIPFADQDLQQIDTPTALATSYCSQKNIIHVSVGFERGGFRVYRIDTRTSQLNALLSHSEAQNGAITAMALSSSYLLTVSEHKALHLYRILTAHGRLESAGGENGAHRLASLRADSILAPMTLAIRATNDEIIASIVYSFFHIGCGWSLGIQELHFNRNGEQVTSRITTTVESQYNLVSLRPPTRSTDEHPTSGPGHATRSNEPSIIHQEPPTSVSYSHPYLLTSHSDNTLTVYLVVSTTENLFVKGGQRLWGHTSSVATVQVSDRGKAVSVSSRGGEIRIWELENLIASIGTTRPSREESGIQVSPENQKPRMHGGVGILSVVPHCELGEARDSIDTSRPVCQSPGCIGFDDERVLLVCENQLGTQFLELYDFT